MTIDTKAADVATKLEELAVMLGGDFLREGNCKRVIGLHGAEPPILNLVQGELEKYFNERGEKVAVQIGGGDYPIDVGYFIANTSAQ